MKDFLRKIIILVVVIILASFFSNFATNLYDVFFQSGSSFVDVNFLIGFPLAYLFFLTFFFTAFGGNKKYWWIGILLIPAVAFELYFDFSHLYFSVALAVVGWLLGWVVAFALLKKFQKDTNGLT